MDWVSVRSGYKGCDSRQIHGKIPMNIHDVFVAFSHRQSDILTSPSSITACCGEGEKFCSSHRSYQPFTAKLGPVQLYFPTLNTACKHPKHKPQLSHYPPVILDVLYPCSLKTQGKHQPLQIISRPTDSPAKDQTSGGCLSHRDLESFWLRAESLSSARSSGCC